MTAFSSGKVSANGQAFKRYIGVASVKILAVNPNKDQLNSIFNTDYTDEPVYTSTVNIDGKDYPSARIEFILQTIPENNNDIDTIFRMSLFVRNQPRYNRDKTKLQVIDCYGNTAWVTQTQLENHEVPTYANGKKATIDPQYRAAYVGEEELTNFVKAFLNIPNSFVYKNGEWVPADNLKECYARFGNIGNMFTGNFEEVRNAIALQKDNAVKVLTGIRTADDGRQFQAVYTRMFMRNGVSNYNNLEKDLNGALSNGAYPTTEFDVCPLREFTIASTPISESAPEAANPFSDPFGPSSNQDFF